MKRKIKRSLLLISLFLILCTCLPGCAALSETTDVSDVEVDFDDRTVTVSSPKDNTFKLDIVVEANSKSTLCTSENLRISGGIPQTYVLESLVGDYVSENANISAVTVQSANISNVSLICYICFVLGFVIGVIICCIR